MQDMFARVKERSKKILSYFYSVVQSLYSNAVAIIFEVEKESRGNDVNILVISLIGILLRVFPGYLRSWSMN